MKFLHNLIGLILKKEVNLDNKDPNYFKALTIYENKKRKFHGFNKKLFSNDWNYTKEHTLLKIESNTYLRNKHLFDFLYFNNENIQIIYSIFSPTFQYPIKFKNKNYKSIYDIIKYNDPLIQELVNVLCIQIQSNKYMIDILKSTGNKILMDSQNLFTNKYGDNIFGRILMCIRSKLK